VCLLEWGWSSSPLPTTALRCGGWLSPGTGVVLAADRLLDAWSGQVREISRQEGVPLVDVGVRCEDYGHVPGQSVDDLLIDNDGIHPNDAGHELTAEWLTEILLAREMQETSAGG
jgi:hypothetical protein